MALVCLAVSEVNQSLKLGFDPSTDFVLEANIEETFLGMKLLFAISVRSE